jgi:hypothetical protein
MTRVVVASSAEGTEVIPVQEEVSTSYCDIRSEAEKKFRDRKRIEGRNGEGYIRKYHLTDDERVKLVSEAAATGGVINPLKNRVGAYWGQVEALIQLGANEFHSLKKIRDKMQEILSGMPKKKKQAGKVTETDAWTDFYGKKSRDGAAKPKDGLGRIEQNFKVLQRLPRAGKDEKNPYGAKLAQFGMTVDIEYREAVAGSGMFLPFVSLNTTHAPWTDLDNPPQVKPLYLNPNSRRRGKQKAEGVASASEAASIPPSAPVIPPTVSLENPTVVQESIEGKSSEDGQSSGSALFIPPDDFEEQVADYETEQAESVAKVG